MKETVLITGINGSLAKNLKKLLSKSYNVKGLTTNKSSVNNKSIFYWDINNNYIDPNAFNKCNHIVHLSGHSILKPWIKKNKKLIYESRVSSGKLLFSTCEKLNVRPKTFVSASAIGIYGLHSTGHKKENSKIGNDWIAKLISEWEIASKQFEKLGSRVIQMRISVLLSKDSGLLKYNLLSMKYGIGFILGDKDSPINWIHIQDAANFIEETIRNEKYKGTYNLSNEKTVTHKKFLEVIKKNMFPYAMIINIPISLIRIFLGKRILILNSKITVDTTKLKETGFLIKYPKIDEIINK